MTAVIYTNLTENKGKSRLWLEGTRLKNVGIDAGQRYDVFYDTRNNRLELRMTELGKRKVSQRKRAGRVLPVIDINNSDLAKTFGKLVNRLRVVIRSTSISITVHHLYTKMVHRLERLKSRLMSGEALSVVSLAHGAGILDHAVHQGFRSSGVDLKLNAAIEIEKRYLDCSQTNNPIWSSDSVAIEAPMEEVEYERLKQADLIIFGCPCTGASIAGRSKNKLEFAESHKTAGALFDSFLTAVKVINPAGVIFENVLQYRNTASMTVIRSVLETHGYTLHEIALNGNRMGALENRDRLCMIAVTNGIEFSFDALQALRSKESTIGEILEDIPLDSKRWKYLDYLDSKEKRDIAAGKGFKRQLIDADSKNCGCIGRGYSKYRSTEPHLYCNKSGKQRLLTKREHAAVKTIPYKLVSGLSDTLANEVMGQSVIHCAFQAVSALFSECLKQFISNTYIETHQNCN